VKVLVLLLLAQFYPDLKPPGFDHPKLDTVKVDTGKADTIPWYWDVLGRKVKHEKAGM
jgi:hypothetical protein